MAATGGAGGIADTGDAGDDGSGNSGNDGSGNSDGAGGDQDPPNTTENNCSIISSNPVCGDCIAAKCCMVINKAMDEALYSAIACLDCFLEGKGHDCCDEEVGNNKWIGECVDWNCAAECL